MSQFGRSFVSRWFEAAHADEEYSRVSPFWDGAFVLDFGEASVRAVVHRGRLEALDESPHAFLASDFALRAPAATWREMLRPVPPPMRHDLFASIAHGHVRFEGDVRKLLQQYAALSRLIEVGRTLENPGHHPPPDPPLPAVHRAVGRTVNVTLDGVAYPVFYFESGEGVPILCQHSAGNENRQWRHLLEDAELGRRHRVIAYDLPGHGKSWPPYGVRWWEQDRPLTSDFATRFVVALADALRLERPIFLGCSIGGVIALHLAARFPERFRAFVALAGAIPTGGFDRDWWVHPELNSAMMVGSVSNGVMAADIPEWDRRVTRWLQCTNPRTLRDDLYLWSVDNADESRADAIDGTRVPVFLLAGEYDYTCPPEHVEACAKRIRGARYRRLEGLGHFPMSEDYARFRPHLMAVLAEIAG